MKKIENIYQEYLKWFYAKAKTYEGVQELRSRKAFDKWYDYKAPVEPYPFAIWRIKDGNAIDEEAMAEAGHRAHERNVTKYNKMSKYINGDPKQGEYNPEYNARFLEGKTDNQNRRNSDPEWNANDFFTDEFERISQSGPKLYEEWEKENKQIPPSKPIEVTLKPIETSPSILERLKNLFKSEPELTQTHSYMELQKILSELEKK